MARCFQWDEVMGQQRRRRAGGKQAQQPNGVLEQDKPQCAAVSSKVRGRAAPAGTKTQKGIHPAAGKRGPRWDTEAGNLYLHGRFLFHLETQAYAERAIVATFETCGWPTYIANPFNGNGRADYAKRRRSAVYELNRHQLDRPTGTPAIRFFSVTNGRIGWAELR